MGETTLAARTSSDAGDIMIHAHPRHGEPTYVLHAEPGPGQVFTTTAGHAFRQAFAFAKQQRVRVWLTDGETFELLKDFRSA
jgi:hypothetical protein